MLDKRTEVFGRFPSAASCYYLVPTLPFLCRLVDNTWRCIFSYIKIFYAKFGRLHSRFQWTCISWYMTELGFFVYLLLMIFPWILRYCCSWWFNWIYWTCTSWSLYFGKNWNGLTLLVIPNKSRCRFMQNFFERKVLVVDWFLWSTCFASCWFPSDLGDNSMFGLAFHLVLIGFSVFYGAAVAAT